VRENVRLVTQARPGAGDDLDDGDRATYRDLIERAEHVLAEVGLSRQGDLPVTALSHGDQRKLEVALLVALGPDVLMFDEPTAGMSVDEVPVILGPHQDAQADSGRKTILLVEHKMDVIRTLADRIVVLHNGRARRRWRAGARS
jgi:branched-chain amino acid transport system ATP-binding protein